jgi:hypothetical protein
MPRCRRSILPPFSGIKWLWWEVERLQVLRGRKDISFILYKPLHFRTLLLYPWKWREYASPEPQYECLPTWRHNPEEKRHYPHLRENLKSEKNHIPQDSKICILKVVWSNLWLCQFRMIHKYVVLNFKEVVKLQESERGLPITPSSLHELV